ncbi:MAG TPA: hypothetical protein DCL38_04850 [Lachnospiraceae bacterium]|nr:hypothetical protein [Lachnospiraceae bacterium]
MLVLAGPGSGKTAVLSERIFNLTMHHDIPPDKILVLTFSREAAGEMQQRFLSLSGGRTYPVHFGTFHAVFYQILKKEGLYNENSILSHKTKKEYVSLAGRMAGCPAYRDEAWQEETLSRIAARKIGVLPEFSEKSEGELFEKVFSEYSEKCRREKKLDFDDMITECIRLLTQSPGVLKKWQERYEYILVDEFQDIDLRQYEVLKLLAGERANIFAVGDDDQSIYGFRGACPSIMRRFKDEHRSIRIVNLVTNYRCKREIIENAVCLIGHNKERLPKRQEAARAEAGLVDVEIFKSSHEEAEFVTGKLRELMKEAPGTSTGILYRMGRCAEVLEAELKKQGIPYFRAEKTGSFFNEEWVKDVLSYMRFSLYESEGDLLRILNRPDRGLSREAFGIGGKISLGALADYHKGEEERLFAIHRLQKDMEFIRELPVRAGFNYILKGIGYEKELLRAQGGRSETVNELTEEFLERTGGHNDMGEFLKHVEMLCGISQEKGASNKRAEGGKEGQITLQTVHASKGLEYDTVFVIGMREGYFPHKRAETNAETEEERRLFYVAMTRARDRLYICGQKKDDFGKSESRFLHELKDADKRK